ncbi:hypothetical protein BC629DRAFT_428522 [Irpex lacteus]|nr:hypothetical protein BC629DRAFT_428522 [Irpex lacteus]
MGTQRPAARNPIISEDRATPSQATGWAAVEKTLTDYDREEIGNYKEDMDTLLVFTGLYSAVLAAFVVVSYTQLQEDTAAESLKALRTLTQQTAVGCTILDGHPVNSTAVPASPLPLFQPSVAAIRVNVLWFASLVVSLSTASFAILVKQWLRAYLAFTSSSPQGQLRVRQFRREGLKVWKVFAIASILPVLLQVSLALFFIGLCFFSSNINPTLGDTIVPLVCAWAFLIISVTVSPVFSARCPYKTPALSSITTALRIRVWLPTAAIAMPWVWRLTAGVVRAICTIILILASTLFVGVVIILDALPFGPKTFGKAFVASVGLVDDKLQALSCSDWTTPQEEAEVLTDNSKDLSILAAADDFQANAELDLVTMKHALEHSKPTWDETVGFLVQVIGNRVPLPTPFSEGPKGSLVDFNLLSIRTKAAISELFDCYVMSRLPADAESKGPLSDSTSTAGAWAAFILFSMYPSYAHIPPKILILSVDSWLDRVTDTGRRIDLPSMPVVLRCIVQDCDELQLLYKVELVTRVINRPAIMSSDDGNEVDPSLSTALRHAAFRLARGLERHLQDASYSLDNAWTLTHRQTISLLFNMCGASHRYSHRIDCGELMGNVLDLLLSQGTHRGVRDCIVSWMAQPSPFVLKDTWNLALRIFSMRRASGELTKFPSRTIVADVLCCC